MARGRNRSERIASGDAYSKRGGWMRQSSPSLHRQIIKVLASFRGACPRQLPGGSTPQVVSFVIVQVVVPQFPNNAQPTIGQAAIGVVVGAAMRADVLIIIACPGRSIDGQACPFLDDIAELPITGSAEGHPPAAPAFLGNWAGAGQGLHQAGLGEALAVFAQFDQQAALDQHAGLRQRVKDGTVRVLLVQLAQLAQFPALGLQQLAQQPGQQQGFLLISRLRGCSRGWLRMLQASETGGQFLRLRIAVLAGELTEGRISQLFSCLGVGVCLQESQCDLGIQGPVRRCG
jgi:hypothetical protein